MMVYSSGDKLMHTLEHTISKLSFKAITSKPKMHQSTLITKHKDFHGALLVCNQEIKSTTMIVSIKWSTLAFMS